PGRVHAGRNGPDHILPVSRVDIVVEYHHELGVHELTQETPYSHHHALGVPRVLLLHGHHRHTVGATFRWQIEIDDLGELLTQDRDKDFVERHSQNRRLIRWPTGIGRVINGVAA